MDAIFNERFLEAKREALSHYFSRMNPRQQEAVFQVNGPLLILAGAGSGKTTVIVNRIANLIQFGNGYQSSYVPPEADAEDLHFLEAYAQGTAEDFDRLQALCAFDRVWPYRILAITFTNKAAGELKERLGNLLGPDANDIQASTFHSACVRILRREIEHLGYGKSFTIYDTDDCQRVIKNALSTLKLDEKTFPPRAILTAISHAKDLLWGPDELFASDPGNYRTEKISQIYRLYQTQLKTANAVDFDDLIVLTVRLFQQFPDILENYQRRWRYVMVDEYQDTNHAQYMLVSLLASAHQNICVVGDDDQSIYKFRGANIENILSFEQQFEGAVVIRLEQNYRCTKVILDVANHVIANNQERKGKTLWTENEDGGLVKVYRANDENDEAKFIADSILDNVKEGDKFAEHAILYRMNAQSNTIEKALIRSGIPYRVISGTKFYERKEIKDVMAYLSVLDNAADALRLRRIINEPKRGIGDATVAGCGQVADSLGITLFEVIATADQYAMLSKKAKPLMEFASMLQELMDQAEELPLPDLFDLVVEKVGYIRYLETLGFEGQTRIENVNELKTNIISYCSEHEEPTLAGFLEEAALYTDMDTYDANADAVVMMTIHSAKGLEYKNVFLAGMEDGVFPGMQAVSNPVDLEEERRLAYVGITRAKRRLVLTNASTRMLFGRTNRNRPSCFLAEIPKDLTDLEDHTLAASYNRNAAPSPSVADKRRAASAKSIGVGAAAARPSQAAVDFQVGDRLEHPKYGQGIVLDVKPMGGDKLLSIDFGGQGQKRIMANFGRMTKL